MMMKNSLGSQIVSCLIVALLVGVACVEADTANYETLQTYRLVDVRQTGPNSPKISSYKVGFYATFRTANAVNALQLRPPKGKPFAYQKQSSTRWSYWTKGIASPSSYLKTYPSGAYILQCLGGLLGGQAVVFTIPTEDMVNPSLPYLEASSYRLLTSRKMRTDIDQTLVVRKTLGRGKPFVTAPSPASAVNGCFAQIRDLSLKGTEGEFVFYQDFDFDASQTGIISIPAGTLKKNKSYNLSLQTDHTATEESVVTPEGSIRHTRGGITFYELVFKTSK
jgi:hypothetical protein